LAQRQHAVVIMLDDDATVVVLHRRKQPRKHERRVWSPVPVMSAVEFAFRTVNRKIDRLNPARTEDDLPFAALVDRTVADQPDVALQQILVTFQNLAKIR